MKLRGMRRRGSGLLGVLLLSMLLSGTVKADWNVKPSTNNYTVELNNPVSGVFIYNKKSVGSEVGTEYYMTYTVKSVEHTKSYRQQGVIGTNAPGQAFPYECYEEGFGGLMKFDMKDILLEEGKTYFLKFTITEDGYNYRIGWAKDEKSRYIEFSDSYGVIKTGLEHFGLWIGDGELKAELIKVRFYDKSGNDLGVMTNAKEANVYLEDPFSKDTQVPHRYNISIKDRTVLAISNKFTPTSDKVYMEYKVKSSKGVYVEQAGTILSTAPTISYPYLNGIMIYNQYARDVAFMDEGPLMTEGAEYLIIFEKKENGIEVCVQKTYNGRSGLIEFTANYGKYNKDANFYSIWLSGIPTHPFSIELEDFKCYDSNKKNLGVQCNMPSEITHFGNLEDYTGCEAVYYNETDDSFYALYENQCLVFGQKGETKEGTYIIDDEMLMTTKVAEDIKRYNYLYMYFSDEEGNIYNRLHTYKITFDTGEGSDVEPQVIGIQDGYEAMKPADPVLEGNTFEGWYTSEGEKYSFDKMVTKSITLYAKWAKTTYTSGNMGNSTEANRDSLPYAVLCTGTVILIAAIVVGTIVVVSTRRKKHADVN